MQNKLTTQMKYKKAILVSIICLFFKLNSIDLYFCTATDSTYYDRLLNLIGSLHKTNFDNIKELAVFDLGMTNEQIQNLEKIQKIKICQFELTHPDLLKPFRINSFRSVKGWYAWKPVAIKQSLDMYPHVLWIDAGTTVLKSLDNLFKYVDQNGYFLITVGDEIKDNFFLHNIRWQTTKFLIEKFQINSKQKEWILTQEAIAGSLIGVSKKAINEFINEWYEFTKDLKNFQDDGSTPQGFGTGRHDQALLGLIAYTKGLKVLKMDYTQSCPIYLNIDNKEIPFYITWNSKYLDQRTDIYHSRTDLSNNKELLKYIKYK